MTDTHRRDVRSTHYSGSAAQAADRANFGPAVVIIDPTMTTAQVNAAIAPIDGDPHRQIFFLPGIYGSALGRDTPDDSADIVLAAVPENTAIAGLGTSPDDTRINGSLHVDPRGMRSLSTFYRSLTNLTIDPIEPGNAPHTMNWVTSQTAPFRRVQIEGNLDLEGQPATSPAFGSHFINTKITGNVFVGDGRNTAAGPGTWSQGMYFLRNCELGGAWNGFGGLFVFCGVEGAPQNSFGPETAERPSGDAVTLETTPLTREAPFLYLDRDELRVFVPGAASNTRGIDWAVDERSGTSLPLHRFFIARPSDVVDDLNAQLSAGKHLILTPGEYQLDGAISIDRPGTVVLGLGFATLTPTSGTAAIEVGDAAGVILSGINVVAGTVNSEVLLRIGRGGTGIGRASDPTTLTDVHILVPDPGRATTTAVIDQDHVLIDGSWMKRADSGWETSLADHGLIVDGNSVSVYGMWLEHYQKTQILWNGDGGRVVFLQNEPPYDPPSGAGWRNGTREGYPFLKVANEVTSFTADGVHTWARFNAAGEADPCYLSSAIETPAHEGVRFRGILAAVISYPNSRGGFRHLFNDHGPAIDGSAHHLTSAYPQSDMFGISASLRVTTYPSSTDDPASEDNAPGRSKIDVPA